ncbi:MAG TPA: MFS transporter, partial [Acidimicrobiales bacterium]|nr:MFS transporter [Acidimicrobiales bacterium]
MTKVLAFSQHAFRSLRIRNYRLFFTGQLVSLTGTWMQSVAMAWLVLRLGGGGTAVGTVAGLQFLPVLVAGPWGGLLADRVDKRRALIATQVFSGVPALALTIVTATGVVDIWMVFVASFLNGCAFVVDAPTRQAFVVEMVGEAELTNAIGLNSAMFNVARVVGPAIGGLLIPVVGIWPCFLLNTLSFAAVVGGLLAMRPEELLPVERAPRARGQLREGLRHVWSSTERRTLLVALAVVGLFALNTNVVLPLLARFTFDGDAGTLGTLTAVTGLGSLAGALGAAGRESPSPRLLVGSCALAAVALGSAGVAPTFWLVLVALALFGAGVMAFVVTTNALLQLSVDAAFRGRVMALYSLVLVGSTPIGGPLTGWVAEHFGARVALGAGGVGTVAAVA